MITKISGWLFTALYSLAALALISIALSLGGHAVFEVWSNLSDSAQFNSSLWSALGRIIISMAILDVGKYLLEEEVLRDRELRSATEARQTLTKFMVIVCIAVSLDALVNMTRVQNVEDLHYLIYSAGLLLTGVATMLGLGMYQRLSKPVEEKETAGGRPRARAKTRAD